MSAQPDETTSPPPEPDWRAVGGLSGHLIERDPHGNLRCGGQHIIAAGVSPSQVREWARDDYEPSSETADQLYAIADFLDSAQERARHAAGAFPDDPPPPRRPRVELRQQVDVDGVEVADLVVRVPMSATDTAAAVTDAARALHDAALAVTRVLAVEGASS